MLNKTLSLGAAGFLLATASFALGLATPETTPDTAPAAASQTSRPAPQTTPETTLAEDDPNWNCFTDGNKSCGNVPRVDQALADALAEGDDAAPMHSATRDWESCMILENPNTIACPDGFVLPN